MQGQDLYDILGVGRNAGPEELKKAFRRQAMNYHPDRNPDDPTAEEKFKEVQEAYRVLSDPNERAYYDRTGRVSGQGGGRNPFDFGADPGELFSELFGQFFSGYQRGRYGAGPQKGKDRRVNVRVSFNDAAFGTDINIKIHRREGCSTCHGSGAQPGKGPVSCPICNGSGYRVYRQGFMGFRRTCNRCNGSGKIIRDKCLSCGGTGKEQKERSLSVKIPPGIRDGNKLKLAGEGDHGPPGKPPGDLYVVVNVDSHPRFERRDDDVILKTPITYPQAVLGADVSVPTLEGYETLRIPAGTPSGKLFRLRGKGFPHLNGMGRGDQHVVVHVDIPTRLTEPQKELIRQLAQLSGDAIEPRKKGFIEKVKEILS